MQTLNHYTITTGHNRVSPRSEVGVGVAESLATMCRAGTHPMPGFAGYTVLVRIEGAVLAATVERGAVPLVTMLVCRDADGLQRAIRVSGCIPAVSLAAPAVLVDVHATAAGDPALDWLGDFERCLAWAWIEVRQ